MADFSQAVAKTELFEGGYTFDSHDSGGETYRGVSRANWPKWAGWPLIDSERLSARFPQCLDEDGALQGLVVDFYHRNYWLYDAVTSQAIANKVFDLSVNVGKVHAIKIVQQAVGTNVDGNYGPQTERLLNLHPEGSLLPLIITSAQNYHKSIVLSHPEDAVFLKGWLTRDAA